MGLQIVDDNGLSNIGVEVDALNLVKGFQSGDFILSPLGHLFHEIRKLSD